MPAATRGQQFREEAALSLRTYGLFPRFRMKTTLKTAASCALPPGVCAAHDLIVVLLVVALCAIRGAKRLIFFFRSDGGKSVRRAQMLLLLLPLFPAAYVKLVIENSDLKVVNQKSQKL